MSGYSLEHTRVLVVDGNRNMRQVLRAVLQTLGVRAIDEAAEGGEAFDSLRRAPVDIILCDCHAQPVDGPTFVRMVRNAADSPNPFVPIIMQTLGVTSQGLSEARAAGVHELIGKPLSAKALYASIRTIIEYPRPFIRTADHFGPNHRAQQTDFDGEDQRRNPPRAADPDAWGPEAWRSAADEPSVILTPEEIRMLLGGDDAADEPPVPSAPHPDALSPTCQDDVAEPLIVPVPAQFQLQVAYSAGGVDEETVRRAELAIKGFRSDYLGWARKDLLRMRRCFDRAWAQPPGERGPDMRGLYDIAYDVAGQGGCFGYPLITAIGSQLCRFIDGRARFGEAEMRAVRLHVDAMRGILAKRIEGDGGHNRDALVGGLRAVLAKIGRADSERLNAASPSTYSAVPMTRA